MRHRGRRRRRNLIDTPQRQDADDGEQSRNDGVHIGSQPRVEVKLVVAGQGGVGRDAGGEPRGEGRGHESRTCGGNRYAKKLIFFLRGAYGESLLFSSGVFRKLRRAEKRERVLSPEMKARGAVEAGCSRWRREREKNDAWIGLRFRGREKKTGLAAFSSNQICLYCDHLALDASAVKSHASRANRVALTTLRLKKRKRK